MLELICLGLVSFYSALRPIPFKTKRAQQIFLLVYACVVVANIVFLVAPTTCLDSFSIECT